MNALEEKIQDARNALALAADMSEYYYHEPLVICYSGGKDSDVMLDIAMKCLNPSQFEVINSHTTVDAPETVYHIRNVFKDLQEKGIKTTIQYPTYKGEPTNMWKLIVQKRMPPTRIVRYCCQVLKEASVPHRLVAVGVREDESSMRRNRDAFAIRLRNTDNVEWKTVNHTYAMFQLDKRGAADNKEVYECSFIQGCKKQKSSLCQPIYKFTDKDIWKYVKANDIPMNPLYAKGYKRVGCIGCPLGNIKNQRKEFKDYPKYKENYIRAFDRMLKKRREDGLSDENWDNGEDVFRWWMGENPKQLRMEDFL